MRRIDVIIHENENRELEKQFTLGLIAREWRKAGIETRIVRGVPASPDADLAVLHVDLSVIPERFLRVAESYPRVVNGEIRDIRKSAISQQRVLANDSWRGPVIVKSDLNHGGRPEASLAHVGLPRRIGRAFVRKVLGRVPTRPALDYDRYESIDLVPEPTWSDKTKIVERFLPETDGELFVLRKYLFLGEVGLNWSFRSPDPIVRGHSVIETRREPPPREILDLRRSLQIDFGRFDYVMSESRPALLDVNKTPAFTGGTPSPRMKEAARELAPAIKSFFEAL